MMKSRRAALQSASRAIFQKLSLVDVTLRKLFFFLSRCHMKVYDTCFNPAESVRIRSDELKSPTVCTSIVKLKIEIKLSKIYTNILHRKI